ncbi:MAG: hypothetical protein AB7L92_05090 [Alphaproteobacteria bacterium]
MKNTSHKISYLAVALAASFFAFGSTSEAYAGCAGMKAAFKGVKCEKKVMIQCPANSKFLANNGTDGAFTGPHKPSARGNFIGDGYEEVDPGSELTPEKIVKELCSENNQWKSKTGKCTCPKDQADATVEMDILDTENSIDAAIFSPLNLE